MISRRNFLLGLIISPVVIKATEMLSYGEQAIVLNEGKIITFYTGGTSQGEISITGATCVYGPFIGAHWKENEHA